MLKPFVVSRPDLVSEEDTNEEGLELPESDGEGEGGHRLKSFRDQDMHNPAFSIGLVFPSVDMQNPTFSVVLVKITFIL